MLKWLIWPVQALLTTRGRFTACAALFLLSLSTWPIPNLTFFAPLLVTLFHRRPLISVLWISFACGLILDLFSPQPRLGIYALQYSLTSAVLYQYRHLLFEDRPSSVPIMTAVYSMLAAILGLCIVSILGTGAHFSRHWLMHRIVLQPINDLVFASVLCWLPKLLIASQPSVAAPELANRPR